MTLPSASFLAGHPEVADQLEHGADVAHPGKIRKPQALVGEQGGGENGQGGVFGPAGAYLAGQAAGPLDPQDVHGRSSFGRAAFYHSLRMRARR